MEPNALTATSIGNQFDVWIYVAPLQWWRVMGDGLMAIYLKPDDDLWTPIVNL